MRKLGPYWLSALLLLSAAVAQASIFGTVRGIVHDPQHRPVQNATVTIKAKTSDWTTTTTTDSDGEFVFNAVPIGQYTVTVSSSGFDSFEQDVIVESDTVPILHLALNIAGRSERVNMLRK